MSAPNAEPVIVMDDELLRDLSDLVYPHGRGASEDARIRAGADLTRQTGVIRRLMAAWLNEGIRREKVQAEVRIAAARVPDCFEMNHEARIANYERQWTRVHDWARVLGCPPGVVTLDWLQQEVAERQARAVDVAQQLDRVGEECARRGDALRRAERERDEARAEVTDYARDALSTHAEVERLRGAQQQMVNEAETHADGNVGDGCWELAERFARLAAADPSSVETREGLRDVHWVDEGPYRRFTYRDSSGTVWVDMAWCGETPAEQRTTEPTSVVTREAGRG